jgi:hemolysin III
VATKQTTTSEISTAVRKFSKDGSVHVTDELINTVTSLAGACFAILGAALLIVRASVMRQPWAITGFGIYGASLISLFVSSTLHHGYNGSERTDRWLRTYDYVSVFLLIAGTITPLVLVRARTPYGWSVFGAVWAIALLGVTLRVVFHELPGHITSTFYIVLGWLAALIVAANLHLSLGGLLLLIAGGILFSFGFVMFILERPNIKPGFFGFHELWHCMVLGGALCQYLMMYFYVLGH